MLALLSLRDARGRSDPERYDPSEERSYLKLKITLAEVYRLAMTFAFKRKLEGGLNIYPETVRQLPIRRIDFENLAEKLAHDEIVRLVERMLALQKVRQPVRREDDLDRVRNLERQIAQVDAEMDQRVYALYGLTEDEIRVVEGKE